jgi:phosphoribulokinase
MNKNPNNPIIEPKDIPFIISLTVNVTALVFGVIQLLDFPFLFQLIITSAFIITLFLMLRKGEKIGLIFYIYMFLFVLATTLNLVFYYRK